MVTANNEEDDTNIRIYLYLSITVCLDHFKMVVHLALSEEIDYLFMENTFY